ncbi:copper resistance protein CopC [Solirubrobacter ginsenosidimutans]|uniref:Copper resistance protein CopC n=1 Tax=Solirubrobacter ginsenosidimutans TaxID=490573 RepID=A0A9X3MS82_9ACTN|nr:copper resistance protein CopC [Solirubrobacter ginsenosidimutans]MDA0161575.1 copper resistance protein CopC [Solirubrobacter ginsenosidimutans]
MIRRVVAATLVLLLALPATSAFAHAALVRTVPSAAGIVTPAPKEVALTFSEPIEPRFAAVSISDADGNPVTNGNPRRKAGDPTTVTIPLKDLQEGWYLVYWRVISVDGHPVRGAFTFAVGPNAGPAPQFVVPSISETAATPRLVAARWITILAAMAAIGLFVMRMLIARPARQGLKAVAVACGVAVVAALVAAPVYLLFSTAQFSLRKATDFSALAPLLDVSAFGRGYLRLELCLALFGVAAGIAVAVDRPDRARRSVAEILATTGALLAAGAVLLIPGVSGHPSQTSPRGLAVALDVIHLSAGAVWIGGLIGLLVLWWAMPRRLDGLRVVVPRFSNVAFGSVLALIATGTVAAILQLPTLSSLWQTGYGQALLIKIGLLCVALLLAAVNLLRTRPRLLARQAPAAQLLRRLVGGEVIVVAGAVFAAAVLTSLAPPAKAVADLGKPAAKVGPGAVKETVTRSGYQLALDVTPNRAAVPNRFQVRLTKGGRPVEGATITTGFAMLDMEMGTQSYKLEETAPGTYGREAPALVMVGHWGLTFDVEPPDGAPFTVTLLDMANG